MKEQGEKEELNIKSKAKFSTGYIEKTAAHQPSLAGYMVTSNEVNKKMNSFFLHPNQKNTPSF
jgi:hypothetical protein